MTTTINPATIITDIRVAMSEKMRSSTAADEARNTPGYMAAHKKRREAERTHTDFHQGAIRLFREINGWDTKPDPSSFRISDIGKRSGRWPHDLSSELFDHCIWIRGGGKCAAIIAQPYEHAKDDLAKRVAAEHGVECHVPPHPFASFHYPGWTKFYVFTMPGHKIQWLPEQVNGFADPAVFMPSASTHGRSGAKNSA